MTTKSLVSACRKHGVEPITDNGHAYRVSANGKYGSWYNQDGRVVAARVRRASDKDDMFTDYCAGHFCRTVKDFVSSVFGS